MILLTHGPDPHPAQRLFNEVGAADPGLGKHVERMACGFRQILVRNLSFHLLSPHVAR